MRFALMGMDHATHAKKRVIHVMSAAMALGACSLTAQAYAQEASASVRLQSLERRPYGPDEAPAESYGEPIAVPAPLRSTESLGISRISEAPPPASWAHPRVLIFAGGGNEALTWSPRQHGSEARFSYRADRVELGDVHAGLGFEASGATLAIGYVEKKYETGVGSNHENFTGVTVTWRR